MNDSADNKEREQELVSLIDWDRLPRHIAIIMDGNGRWAGARNLPRIAGHQKGVKSLRNIITLCSDFKIDVLTVYAFSTENWKRPAWEVNFLLKLPYEFFNEDLQMLMDNNIKLKVTGEPERLPARAQNAISNALDKTANNTGMIFNLAINYGGRKEIVDAAGRIAAKVLEGDIDKDAIDEELFNDNLFTADIPDPELVIRTSGEMRISNFLLWQIAYSELYFTGALWPDFGRIELMEAIYDFQRRQRRFGGLEAE